MKLKKLFGSVFLFFIILPNLVKNCESGCLSCKENPDKTQTCQLCDLFNFFKSDGKGGCIQIKSPGCLVPSYDFSYDTCFKCQPGLFYDKESNSCAWPALSDRQKRCDEYDTLMKCVKCQGGFYPDADGKCQEVGSPISFCETYSSSTQCGVCQEGYFLTSEEKCSSIPHTFNHSCLLSSTYQCLVCQDNHFLNRNHIHDLDFGNLLDIKSLVQLSYEIKVGDNKPPNVCYQGQISNCKEFTNASLCKVCEDGFYLSSDSRSCPKNPYLPITNCKSYVTHDECSVCENGFYLIDSPSINIKKGCGEATLVEFCKTYSQTQNVCSKCEETHFLNSNNCETRANYPISSCEVYESEADTCSICLANFKLSDDKLFCGAEISKCKEYELITSSRILEKGIFRILQTKTLNCKKCNEKYFTTGSQCQEQNVSNCSVHVENENKCQICIPDFYVDGDGNCHTQTLDFCSIYTGNKNECNTCENMYFLNGTNCSPITTQNCQKNIINSDTCEQCILNYHFPNASTTTCTEKNSEKMPPGCTGNDTITPDKCTHCDALNKLPYKVASMCLANAQGCEKMNQVTNQCDQCKPGYSGIDANKTCTLTDSNKQANPGADSSCNQLIQNSFTSLSLANSSNSCALCIDNTSHYLSSNQCVPRTISLLEYIECGSHGIESDSCETCSANFRPFRVSKQVLCIPDSQISNLGISSSINKCQIRSMISPFECILCENLYSLKRSNTPDGNGLYTSCSLTSSLDPTVDLTTPFSISPLLAISGPKTTASSLYPDNCASVSFSSKNTHVCTKCLGSHPIPVISGYYPPTGSRPKHAFTNVNPESSTFEFFPGYLAIQGCLDNYSSFVKKDDNSKYLTNFSDCLYAREISFSVGFACIRCSGVRGAKVVTAQRDKDGDTIGSGHYTIEDCNSGVCTNDFTKEFEGLYSHVEYSYSSIESEPQKLPYTSVINADSCNDTSKIFVFFGGLDNTTGLSIKPVGPSGSEQCNQQCLSPSDFQTVVDNCQIHFYPVIIGAALNFNGTENLFCLACKPGFKVTKSNISNFRVETCEPISGCDMAVAGGQKWMNQCHQCESGKAWAWNETTKKIDFAQCVEVSADYSGCLIMGNEACVACQNGNILSADGKCVSASDCASLANGGYGFLQKEEMAKGIEIRNELVFKTELEHRLDVLLNSQYLLLSSFISTNLDTSFPVVGCKICNAGSSLYSLENNLICSNASTNKSRIISGCKIYNFSKNGKITCFECDSDRIISKEGDYCLAVAEIQWGGSTTLLENLANASTLFNNCTELAPTTTHPSYTCSKCSTGHFLTITFTCEEISATCELFNEDLRLCDRCASGHMLNSDKTTECIPVFESDVCKTYDRWSRCRECKEANYFPVMYKDNVSRYHVKCVPNDLGGVYAQTDGIVGLFGFSEFSNPDDRSLLVFEDDCKSRGEYYMSISTSGLSGLKLVDDDGNFYFYFLIIEILSSSSFFSFYCLTLNITDKCETLAGHGFCGICEDRYFLNSLIMRCSPGAINNCETFTDQNTCSKCLEGFIINQTNNFCFPRVAENCLTTKTDKDECLTCKEGHYLSTDDQNIQTCEVYSVKECLEYEETQDKCKTCVGDDQFFGQYLDGSDGRCKDHSSVDNCIEYLKNLNGCSKCKEGYYIDIADIQLCLKNPNGIKDCAVYASEVECLYCNTDFYYNTATKSCTPVTTSIDKCIYYKSDGKCAKCLAGNIFVENDGTQILNECQLIQENSCKEWNTPTNCSECIDGKVLTTENNFKICKDINQVLEFCKALQSGSKNNSLIYKCGVCEPEYYLDGAKCQQRPSDSTIEHCESYIPKTELETTSILNVETNSNTSTNGNTGTNTDSNAQTNTSSTQLECSACASGYMLSSDRSKCLSMPSDKFSSKCKSGIQYDSPACGFCGLGMIFDEKGECVSCGGEGCGLCNLGNLELCRACRSGYYMNQDFKCQKMEEKDLLFVDRDEIVADSEISKSGIFSMFLLLLLSIFLIKII